MQKNGFLLSEADIGFQRVRGGSTCDTVKGKTNWKGNYLNTAARLLSERKPEEFEKFGLFGKCLNRYETICENQPKYRPINGFGANLKHPHWGTPNTPLGRQGPKNYDDGVSSIRKSVTGNALPNARQVFRNVLHKAYKVPRTSNDPNLLLVINELFISHDIGQTRPHTADDHCKEIRCCSSGNKKVLDPSLSNSACLPIIIEADDDFYGKDNITCLNLVRSKPASHPGTIQSGEILNKVTGYLDLSAIYGSDVVESNKVRTFVDGKLRLGKNDVFPVDANGEYTAISNRLTAVLITAIFPVFLSRNHNNLASGLKAVNPMWDDEKLFQEARRVNIALYQELLNHKLFLEALGFEIDAPFDENVNPSATAEFISAAYRFFHLYMTPWVKFIDSNMNEEKIPVSDTFGRVDLVQNRFDDLVRGQLGDKLHYGNYSDELYNKFAKNEKGHGIDIFSFDIQRGNHETFNLHIVEYHNSDSYRSRSWSSYLAPGP